MINLSGHLKPFTIAIEDLLLDPNNPRFSELGDDSNIIQESRFADEKVQQNTYDKMKESTFDVNELKDTIKTIGFLPVDRIVVRKWKGKAKDGREKYIVIEGNRRVTALKWLLKLHEIGKENLSSEQISQFSNIECLLLDTNNAPSSASLILPGLRHVSGIKEWGPYQKAKALFGLRKSGTSPQDAAQSLGLSTREANKLYRCYLALEQMKADEEYGDFAEPKMYSYFDEALKRPNIKKWLGWSDYSEKFENKDNLAEFYSWIVPHDENNGLKLPEAKSIRELASFIDDNNALNIFRSAEGTISKAIARFQIDNPQEWQPIISSAISVVKQFTPEMLRQFKDDDIKILESLSSCIVQAISDRTMLLKK